jgi:cell wall-associated NlpC family hydrolase
MLATLALGLAMPLAAQGPGFQVGRLFTDPPAVSYRLGTAQPVFGPVGFGAHALVIDGRAPVGNLFGLGADLSFFRGGNAGAYVIGGVEGGFATNAGRTFWGSWSVGVGYELFPFTPFSIAAEGRYRALSYGRYDGVELGLRLGLNRGPRRSGRAPAAAPPSGSTMTTTPATTPGAAEVRDDLARAGVTEDRATLIANVVQTALDVMGMPYRWGDEGEEGFDCSGLIKYAFGRHGITMPRRSVDQAREGTAVPKALDQLRPGDLLTFANQGSRVSHVGLYIGNGRFIHSATAGVQVSVLSPDDISGRWWYRRWVGVRRIVQT